MANNDDWVDLPLESKAEANDWEDLPVGADHAAEGQAALEHFGNAASMGYLPQLQAATQPAFDKVGDLVTGSHVYEDDGTYTQRRDENIARMKRQEETHPTASTLGTVGGTLASAIPVGAGIMKLPGMAGLAGSAAAKGAGLVGRTAALGQRTGAAAGAAGLQGLVSNPGDVEGEVDPLQGEERLKQAALSGTIAAPLHLGAESASSIGQFISKRLKDKAEKLAFRALGPFKRQVNQNRDEINEIGREALDSGIVRWKPGSAATIEERAQDAAEASGKDLGDLTDKLIDMEGQASSSGMTRKQIADNLRKKLLVENGSGIPGINKRNQTFSDMVDEFENSGKSNLSFADLRKAKMAVQGTEGQDGLINWNRLKNADIPIEEQFHRSLASQLREGEESGAAAIEKAFGGGKTGELERLKTQFGNRKTAASIAGNRADSQRANLLLGLRDAVLASGGAAAGAGALGGAAGEFLGGHEGAVKGAQIGAAIGGLGSKVARDYGAQFSSKTLDAFSRLLTKSPVFESILKKNPTLIPQLLQNLEKQEPKNR